MGELFDWVSDAETPGPGYASESPPIRRGQRLPCFCGLKSSLGAQPVTTNDLPSDGIIASLCRSRGNICMIRASGIQAVFQVHTELAHGGLTPLSLQADLQETAARS